MIVTTGVETVKIMDWQSLDSSWGDPEAERKAAITQAKLEALARTAIPANCEVTFIQTLPYTGTEPLVEAICRPPQTDYSQRPIDC